jgi:hypothetical protein
MIKDFMDIKLILDEEINNNKKSCLNYIELGT